VGAWTDLPDITIAIGISMTCSSASFLLCS